jgi:ABC-type nitrate/sulfonate/bicarbonate transport system substrate-binding protein
VIFSDYDVWGPNGGATPNYFSLQFIQERPEAVKNFVAAMAETLDWANQNPFLAREITSKRLNYDINLINQIYYSPKGLLKPIHAEVWVDLLVEFDEIKPGITVDQIFTNKFNPYNEVNL